MSVLELEASVEQLSPAELETFTKWMADFVPSRTGAVDWLSDLFNAAWDKQIEADAQAGRLDGVIARAKQQIREGKTTAL
jgi:hypothetical protein